MPVFDYAILIALKKYFCFFSSPAESDSRSANNSGLWLGEVKKGMLFSRQQRPLGNGLPMLWRHVQRGVSVERRQTDSSYGTSRHLCFV